MYIPLDSSPTLEGLPPLESNPPPQESRGAYAPLIRGLFSISWSREVRAQEYIVPGEFRITEGSAIFLEMNTGPTFFTCAFLEPNRADLALPAFLQPN